MLGGMNVMYHTPLLALGGQYGVAEAPARAHPGHMSCVATCAEIINACADKCKGIQVGRAQKFSRAAAARDEWE